MKLLLVFVFASSLGLHAFSQEGQLAKSFEEYTAMYKDSTIKLVRNHSEFYAQAKKNDILWKYFKDKKFAANFLKEMKFCEDGIITINLGVEDDEFEKEVAKALGFGKSLWSNWKKGYACADGGGDSGCKPSSPNSKCNTKNCGKSVLKGNLYDPKEVLDF